VDGLDTADNNSGVTFNSATPGSAADRAGLIGGDVITMFDGHTVKAEDDFMDVLKATPVGKTVDVVFIRDGVTKTTKMTTVSQEENSRLTAVAKSQPKGFIGLSDYDRVAVPNSNIYGVRIELKRNRPGDLAGLRDGDIVTEVGQIRIRTNEELISRINRATPGSTVNVAVIRDGQPVIIPVKLGQD